MIILERFEGDFALIESDGKIIKVKRTLLDKSVKEGSVLIKRGDIYYPDEGETKARREKLAELTDSLFE